MFKNCLMQNIINYFERTQEKYLTDLSNTGYFLSIKFNLVFGINVLKENEVPNKVENKILTLKDEIELNDFIRELNIYKSKEFKLRIISVQSTFPIRIEIEKFYNLAKQAELIRKGL